MKNKTAIHDAFQPNLNPANIKELYVDTGDFDRLLATLSSPQTFLVYGNRGAGKTLLFTLLKTELLAKVAEYYGNANFFDIIKDRLYFKHTPKKRVIVPVFMRITRASGTHKELLFDTVHEVIRNTIRTLLLIRNISGNKILREYETQLVEMLAVLENRETSYQIGERIAFRYDLGGVFVPLQLGEESSRDFTHAITNRPVADLRRLHAIAEELLGIVQKEGIELVITLDEFDKISVEDAAMILRAEQGPLFEAMRSNFSFLIPATVAHVVEMEKSEYSGIFTSKPFSLTPFDLEHTKEMIDKRLDFKKQDIGGSLKWNEIAQEKKLSEMIEKSGRVPRMILKELQKELADAEVLPIS